MPEDIGPAAGKIRLKITCPVSVVADMEVSSVQIPALLGTRLVIPKQAPFICALNAGQLVAYSDGEEPISYLISKGICEVRRDICAVMAWGIRSDQIDENLYRRLLADAEGLLPLLVSGSARRELQNRVEFYQLVLGIFKK
ncbi:MAG: hypothetical protein IJV07_00765 [Alphaproteobacteria bacterium]|nr:hypothetical protein [Alphaproteobacteria bacterium]